MQEGKELELFRGDQEGKNNWGVNRKNNSLIHKKKELKNEKKKVQVEFSFSYMSVYFLKFQN